MEFKVTDKINAKDKEIIFQGLLEYNLARLKDKNPQDLGVYLKDDNDELLAGLIGNTHGNWLTVKYLWVSEALRGQSIGSDILRKAEEEARKAAEEARRKAEEERKAQEKAAEEQRAAMTPPEDIQPVPQKMVVKFEVELTTEDATALREFFQSRNITFRAIK